MEFWRRAGAAIRDSFSEPDLVKARAFYFCFQAAMGALVPYLALFYKHTLLLSPHQAGTLMAVRPACLLIASPILGTLADKLNRFRVILIVSLLAYVVCYGSVAATIHLQGLDCQAISKALNHSSMNASRHDPLPHHYTNVLMWKLFDSWPYEMHEYASTESYTHSIYVSLLVVTIFGELVASPAATFADLYLLQTLADKTTLMGRQLIPGVIGWGISTLAMLLVVGDNLLDSHNYCQHGHFLPSSWFLVIFCVLMLCCVAIAWTFHFRRYELTEKSSPTLKHFCFGCKLPHAIANVFKQPSHAVFILIVACFGIAEGMKQLYLYNYLADIGGGTDLFLAVTIIHIFSQIIFLAVSPTIIEKFSAEVLIYVGLFTYGGTFVLYGIVEDAWLIVLIEPISGFNSKVLFVLAVTYVGSPPLVGAALQGLLHGIYTGLGITLGGLIGVETVLKFGYFSVFVSIGCAMLLLTLVAGATHHIFPAESTIGGKYEGYRKLDFDSTDSDIDNIDEQEMDDLRDSMGADAPVLK